MGRDVPKASFETMPFAGNGWCVVAEGTAVALGHGPAVFAIGNGFVGQRGPGDPAGTPSVYLNGIFEIVPIAYHEAAYGYAASTDTRLGVADATGLDIGIDGGPAGPPDSVALDLRAGTRTESWVRPGLELRIERLASMRRDSVLASRVTIRSDNVGRVTVTARVTPPPIDMGRDEGSTYDPRVGPGLGESPWTETLTIDDPTCTGRVDRLATSSFTVAALTSRAPTPPATSPGVAIVDNFVAYAASRGTSDPLATAKSALASAVADGFDRLASEQASWFANFWQAASIALPDAPVAEQALRHAMFQLVQAVGRDGATSIAAKGQTGEGYEGHVFWDADLYVLPALVGVRPDIARAMLVWRIVGLDAARGNARAMGQGRGALYPWRTIGGGECSSFFPAGSAQYHINADIAFALALYVETTGDRTILAEGGAAMLVETALIWLEIGFHDPARQGAFVINRVTGPDEYSALVDNNLYTNLMAAAHLRFAATEGPAAGLLDAATAARMERAAAAMHLPVDADRGIYAQDDAFFTKQPWPFKATPDVAYPLLLHHHPLHIYRHRVAKQADAVLALALLRDRFDPAMRAAMLDAYEAVTVHDSTLSASAFATAAANIGDAPRAFHYWRAALLTDLSNLFGNTGHGLHMAALAGAWTALVNGFAGMRVTGGRLSFAPIAVPELGRYTFRTGFQGRIVEIAVGDAAAEYRLVDGASLDFTHHGEQLTLAKGQTVARGLK